ncbi:hypothetical protein HUS23_09135 [Ectothiorhodospiraceae bacterium 2226]|nr:hypothetical protein HUS23_09135 [Ectothiorhodospiraceae bacterium 2226]
MPFIHVRSLPFEQPLDVQAVIEGLSQDFAGSTGIALQHVTATWTFFAPGHYAVAGLAASHQPRQSHPLLVDLLVPDLNSADDVRRMLIAVASSLAQRTRLPRENIFINCRAARSGRVFDEGRIARW